MSRLYPAIFLFIALAGTVAWSARLMAENDQLQADVKTAVSANESYQQAMHAMAQEQVRLNQQIIERDEAQRTIQRNLAHTQRRLRDASHSRTITDIQRQCLDMDLPGPVLDILRAPAGSDTNGGSGTHLPAGPILLGHTDAQFPWKHGLRPDRVRRGPAGGRPRIAQRSNSDTGILP